MTTKAIKFSQYAITQAQKNTDIKELKDPRYPVRLRFLKNREKASWYLLISNNGKTHWKKLGTWPWLHFDEIKANLSKYIANFTLDPSAIIQDYFPNINLLMDWYLKRSLSNSSISKARKRTIKWAIQKHIKPTIGNLSLCELTRQNLEEQFFWPLQTKLQLPTMRSIWNVLKQTITQAMFLKLINPTELNTLKFTDFIKKRINPAPTRLRIHQLTEVYQNLQNKPVPSQLLFNLMLAHGTRIGETRQLKWRYFCLETKELNIPASITKNGLEHNILLTEPIIKLLTKYRQYQKRNKYYTGEYLFPTKSRTGCISSVKASEMIKDISQSNWTSHSLRKIFRSSLLELGTDSEISEMMLNHRRGTLSETYIHTTAPKLKREAFNKYHNKLIEIQPGILSLTV